MAATNSFSLEICVYSLKGSKKLSVLLGFKLAVCSFHGFFESRLNSNARGFKKAMKILNLFARCKKITFNLSTYINYKNL
jgi:hypothetical protein